MASDTITLQMIIKGVLFAGILIIGVALINIEWTESLLGLIIVPLPFFIMACLKENSIGGGDIKLIGACGFFLGVKSTVLGCIISLAIAIIFVFISEHA
ncbi:prepilin peptidase [Fusibacter sp. 3D3]|uniref:prepilin peptidase n=1 Tax=Fusibacter sp. 3D3 TaxID=1048380 RepID=UPI0027B8F89F|nr:prepilin peptidase [Fusibacter sp. 3D3]